ncbi:hypothetical protein DFH11DRAFT_1724183 [Phellopilus nigrolimitatus]|nr:hypothetical protein DFH11DRAFT_1724183 [Phellopilus nigrolimitatus]
MHADHTDASCSPPSPPPPPHRPVPDAHADASGRVHLVVAAAAAAVVAAADTDDVHVQPLLTLSPQMAFNNNAGPLAAARSHSEKFSARPPTATFAAQGEHDIPVASDLVVQPALLHSLPLKSALEKASTARNDDDDAQGVAGAKTQAHDLPSSTPGVPETTTTVGLPAPMVVAVSPSLPSYDWPTFVAAYAAGRWNPHRIPSAPRAASSSTPATPGLVSSDSRQSDTDSQKESTNSNSSATTAAPLTLPISPPRLSPTTSQTGSGPGTGTDSSTSVSDVSGSSRGSASSAPSSTYSSAAPSGPGPCTPQPAPARQSPPVAVAASPTTQLSASLPPEISPLSGLSQRRASVGSGILARKYATHSYAATPPLLPALASPGTPSESQSIYFSAASSMMPSGPTTPDLATAAATMRWAASSHASLSPLAIPSPEHELTDPMRGMTVVLPVDDDDAEEEGSSDNGSGNRKWPNYGLRNAKGNRSGRRGRSYGKVRSTTGGTSATRRIWERFTSGEKTQSSSEETEVGKSDDDSTQRLPSEPVSLHRRDSRRTRTGTFLSTIEASPLGSPSRERPVRQDDSGGSGSTSRAGEEHRRDLSSRSSSVPAPASAPILRPASDDGKSPEAAPSDYFGLAVRRKDPPISSPLRESNDTESTDIPPEPLEIVVERVTDPPPQSASPVPLSASSHTSEDKSARGPGPPSATVYAPLSVPVAPGPMQSLSLPNTPMHRGVLNRQSSSPLPARTDHSGDGEEESSHSQSQSPPPPPPPLPQVVGRRASVQQANLRIGITASAGAKIKGGNRPGLARAQSMKAVVSGHALMRASREEEEYAIRGYLVPPPPRDEVERRRALCKFNIVHTMPDVNFDRIAYLTKLVFSTKIVVVSLVDEEEEWFKMESGMGLHSLPRDESFCAHAILQRGDEPTVVLDTLRDWRFSKHPLVAGNPNVRFFAAAPLRSSDGFNVGALCIMDDRPHSEFTPRQRHTLKEFAAIVMREMELWRDKIQLRIRDRIQTSMEQFTRECLEIDNETESTGTHSVLKTGSMDRVYERAAKLVKKTLDVEGAIVMDVSHFDVLETTKAEGAISIVCHHGDCALGEAHGGTTTHSVPTDEFPLFMEFFSKYPEGKIAEGIVPRCFRSLLPTRIQHALIVPIFNIDKRPFALLCAYNTADHVKPFLEGHELSYLRAIGVIILSAVLKRRMILADKSKSLFISNISHELRTPLHGILAAAELLGDTELDDNQSSFLRTVQACGTSLVETVNHVLDFTKLSGNSKSGGVENVIHPSKVDLMQLVEEAVEGCWIGHRARLPASSEIGSVYAPPPQASSLAFARTTVETVIDVGLRNKGWQLICEKGGIRRVLMNLIGNSLKFTTSGYVHITLRELPNAADTAPGTVKIELAVSDTGKQGVLENQLFHPFSQENPLQSGTGLGLAIVNSIIRSESVNGQVEVSNEKLSEFEKLEIQGKQPTISMIGFDDGSKGTTLLRKVVMEYLTSWWGFEIVPVSSGTQGDILVLNEDTRLISQAIEAKDIFHPFVLLTSSRADAGTMATVYDFERSGGFCRLVSKPAGPSRLRQVLKACVHMIHFRDNSQHSTPLAHSPEASRPSTMPPLSFFPESVPGHVGVLRRLSQESSAQNPLRPRMMPRAATFNPTLSGRIGTRWGTLLKSSMNVGHQTQGRTRVLVVEDNQILRDLLIRWLGNRGYDFQHAIDGREGVTAFEKADHIDVILVDLSMPVLDGIAATTEIRELEAKRMKEHEQSGIESQPTTASEDFGIDWNVVS